MQGEMNKLFIKVGLIVAAFCSNLADQGVVLEHPAPGAKLSHIPDVPLWVRIRKREDQCFEIIINGESQSITCDRDTVLDIKPLPGEYRLALVATYLPSSTGPVLESTFTITPGARIPAAPPACVHQYHKWWHQSNIWMRSTWRGVVTHKAPTDMWNYQEILHDLKPALVIEFGTRFGGAILYYSDVMKNVYGSEGKYKLLTVDIEPWNIDKQVFSEPNVEILTSPSSSRRVQERIAHIRKELQGPAFAILDADHAEESVLLELQMLVPVLKPGDYVIVEDTNLDGHEFAVAPGWGPCPYDAITKFMAMNRDIFERDLEREVKFGFSQAYAGFLRFRGTDREIINVIHDNPWLEDGSCVAGLKLGTCTLNTTDK